MERLTTFTRKSRIFQNRNYFFFIHCIRLSTVYNIIERLRVKYCILFWKILLYFNFMDDILSHNYTCILVWSNGVPPSLLDMPLCEQRNLYHSTLDSIHLYRTLTETQQLLAYLHCVCVRVHVLSSNSC